MRVFLIIPNNFTSILRVFASILGVFWVIPNNFASILRVFWVIPNNFTSILRVFASILGVFWVIPNNFASIPILLTLDVFPYLASEFDDFAYMAAHSMFSPISLVGLSFGKIVYSLSLV